MKFDDLWPYLEPLSEAQVDSIYKAARSDQRYRVELYGLFAVALLSMTAFSFAVPAFYRTFHPALPFRLLLAAAALGAMWLGVSALIRLNREFYRRAVMRVLRAQGVAGEP
jgi:hypothetical protein